MGTAAVLQQPAVEQTLRFTVFFLKHQLAFWILALLSYGIGRRLTSRITYASGCEKLAFSIGIGLGALGHLVFVMGMLHGINRVFLIPILLTVAVAVSLAWREAAPELTGPWHRCRHKPWLVGAALVVALIFLRLSMLPLFPPTASDALTYHLAEAKIYSSSHGLRFLSNLRFPAFPQQNEMLFTLALALYDDLTAQLVPFLMALTVCFALYAWGRRIANSTVGVLAATLFLFNPKVLELATIAYVDVGMTMFVCLAVYALQNWCTEDNLGWLVLSACMFGFAAGSKYLALAPLLFCGVFVLIRAFRLRRMRDAVLFGTLALLVASPWYLRNIYYTGNPVWPYLGQFFGLGTWTAADLRGLLSEQTKYGFGKSLSSLLWLPWNLTFHAVAFREHLLLPFLVIHMVVLPLSLAVGLRNKKLRPLLALLVLCTLFWFFTVQIIRYLVLVLPFLSLLAAMAFNQVVRWIPALRRQAALSGVTVGLAAGLVALGWVQDHAGKTLHWNEVPVTRAQRDAFLRNEVPPYDFFQALNRIYKGRYTVYALSGGTAYYVDGHIIGDWFGPERYSRVFEHLSNAQALYTELKAMGTDFLEVKDEDFGGTVGDLLLPQLSNSHFQLIYATPRVLGFQLLDSPSESGGKELLRDPSFVTLIKSAFHYWMVMGRPLIATEAAGTHGGEPALRLDRDNFVEQRIQVRPEHLYLLSQYSRWARPGSNVRLQVTWFDRNLSRLGANVRTTRATAEWRQPSMAVTAPQNAVFADIQFSVLAENEQVWLAHPSFLELPASPLMTMQPITTSETQRIAH